MSIKKTRMRGVPPRVRIKYEHKGFYDVPTKLKNSSDNRTGDLALVYNESTALSENKNTSPYINGTSIVVPSEFVVEHREQDYNNGGLPGQAGLPTFRDSNQPAIDYFLNTNSAQYKLLVSGSPTSAGHGFGQPVWSKSKFEIDLPSNMEMPITFSISQSAPLWGIQWANYLPGINTGSSIFYTDAYISASITGSTYPLFNSLTGALGHSYPMLYYSFDKRAWEPIGKGWTPCASFLPSAQGELDPTISPGYVGSHEHATIGFSPGILNYFEGKQKYVVEHRYAEVSASYNSISQDNIFSSSLMSKFYTALTASTEKFSNTTWEEMCSAGQPIDDFGFPFAAKYHATSSQTIRMSNYIKKPFAVERIAVQFDNVEYTLFDSAYNMLEDSATNDPYYSDWITSSISPGVINNFFILNQRKNQKLDSKLLLASLYSTLYEGIYQGLQKSIEGYVKYFWEDITIAGFTLPGAFNTVYEGDFQRALMEFNDAFASTAIGIAQYYFAKLPLQLTLPQNISLTFEDLIIGRQENVDTIREIITWGGITSLSSESHIDATRTFTTLSESFTSDAFSKLYGELITTETYDPDTFYNSLNTGLSHPWIRTIPLYRFLLDIVKKKGIKTSVFDNETITDGQYSIYTSNEVSKLISERIPGLTIQQSKFLASSFIVTKGFAIPKWSLPGPEWQAEYKKLFSGSAWDIPLSQTLAPIYALSREATITSDLSLLDNRLPAMSFSKSITMMLPSKNASSTNFIDFDSFLWQPNNPVDIHPVFCTSTHASLELGGRNGLGAIHMTDREPESGLTNANIVMNSNLDYLGAMIGNMVDGEVEEHALYGSGYLTPRTYNFILNDGDAEKINLVQAFLQSLGYVSSAATYNGQYYVQARKLSDITQESIEKYKDSFYSDTPYLLFPTDELVFGWQQPIPRDIAFCNWVSQSYFPSSTSSSMPSPGIVDISTIRMGNGKVVFYGSEIAYGNESHDTLNQYLTTAEISEPIE